MSSSTFSRSLRKLAVELEAEQVDPEPAQRAPCRGRRRRSAAARGRGRDGRPWDPRRSWRGGMVSPAVAASLRAAMPAAPKASVHFRSLGCPKNQLDTEVMLGSLALAGYAHRRAPRGRRRRGREHLLVHRERARGVDRGDPRGGRPARERAGCARSSSPAACRSATAASSRRSCPRSTPSSARARSRASPRSSTTRSPGRSPRRLRRGGPHPSLRRHDAAPARSAPATAPT